MEKNLVLWGVLFMCSLSPAYSQRDTLIETNAVDGTVVLEVGKPLFLQCSATQYTIDDVQWSLNYVMINSSDDRIQMKGGNLTIERPRRDDTGAYRCHVKVKNIDSTRNFTRGINVTLGAYVEKFESKSINFVEGDELVLICKVIGHPVPTVTWTINDKPIQNDSTVQLVGYNQPAWIPDGKLIINQLNLSHWGTYKCTAKNDFGNHTEEILIRVKDKLAALWPFLGICLEVFVVCLVILIYEKKRNKDLSEDDDAVAANKKAMDGEGSAAGEVRRRKQ